VNEHERLERAREIQAAIEKILMQDWDPIGVRDEPLAKSEYDSYVGGLYCLLASGASPRQVADHLLTIETESMGMDRGDVEAVLSVAEKLCRLPIKLHQGTAAGER
jgi:hypothetical protein